MTQIDLLALEKALRENAWVRTVEERDIVQSAAFAYLASQATNGDAATDGLLEELYQHIRDNRFNELWKGGMKIEQARIHADTWINEVKLQMSDKYSKSENDLRATQFDEMYPLQFQKRVEATKVEVQASEAQSDELSALSRLFDRVPDNPMVTRQDQEDYNLVKAALQRPSVNDDLIKSHDTLLSIARGVQGYWTTSNDCLDSQECVDEAIANAEKLKERLEK